MLLRLDFAYCTYVDVGLQQELRVTWSCFAVPAWITFAFNLFIDILKNVTALFSAQCTGLFNISSLNEKISVGCGDIEIVMTIGRIWLSLSNVYSHEIIPQGFQRKRENITMVK